MPSRERIEQPFRGSINRYDVGDIVFTDCYTDELLLERTIARISRDSVRSFVFHVFLRGSVELLTVHSATQRDMPSSGEILALESGPDFTRAFRRAYGMAPQDVRAMDIRATPDWDSGV